ncbi:YolD-like family protein [Aneurinibacillus tyrosinisolvens]|uniref:YolD-like family protein n=1 Tax=Aneurinibacillus tyrosinisolvens TaxID=1443435 RepID=UPI00063FCE2B|nr:YolD-like family protein [Aneurinibacillus tyrosinisolvens]
MKEKINEVIQRSLEHYEPVTISFYEDAAIHTLKGVVTQFNYVRSTLRVITMDERIHNLRVENITDAVL